MLGCTNIFIYHQNISVCDIHIAKDCLECNNCEIIFSELLRSILHFNAMFSQLDRFSWQQMITLDKTDIVQNAKGDEEQMRK